MIDFYQSLSDEPLRSVPWLKNQNLAADKIDDLEQQLNNIKVGTTGNEVVLARNKLDSLDERLSNIKKEDYIVNGFDSILNGSNIEVEIGSSFMKGKFYKDQVMAVSPSFKSTLSISLIAKNFNSICSSKDGKYVFACVEDEYIYRSEDYGKTWAILDFPQAHWRCVKCSSTGQYVYAGTTKEEGGTENAVYRSDDYGITNTKITTGMPTTTGGGIYTNNSIAISDSGQYVYFINWGVFPASGHAVYISSNYGSTWGTQPVFDPGIIACSPNGQYACCARQFRTTIYNYGTLVDTQKGLQQWYTHIAWVGNLTVYLTSNDPATSRIGLVKSTDAGFGVSNTDYDGEVSYGLSVDSANNTVIRTLGNANKYYTYNSSFSKTTVTRVGDHRHVSMGNNDSTFIINYGTSVLYKLPFYSLAVTGLPDATYYKWYTVCLTQYPIILDDYSLVLEQGTQHQTEPKLFPTELTNRRPIYAFLLNNSGTLEKQIDLRDLYSYNMDLANFAKQKDYGKISSGKFLTLNNTLKNNFDCVNSLIGVDGLTDGTLSFGNTSLMGPGYFNSSANKNLWFPLSMGENFTIEMVCTGIDVALGGSNKYIFAMEDATGFNWGLHYISGNTFNFKAGSGANCQFTWNSGVGPYYHLTLISNSNGIDGDPDKKRAVYIGIRNDFGDYDSQEVTYIDPNQMKVSSVPTKSNLYIGAFKSTTINNTEKSGLLNFALKVYNYGKGFIIKNVWSTYNNNNYDNIMPKNVVQTDGNVLGNKYAFSPLAYKTMPNIENNFVKVG